MHYMKFGLGNQGHIKHFPVPYRSKLKAYEVGIGICITHFYCLAVEAGFHSDVVECLLLDPAAQVRFPPRAVGIFLHPVTFSGHCGGPRLVFRASLSRKCPGITAWFRLDSETNQFKAGKYEVGIGICITHFYCLAVEAGFTAT